MSENGSKFSTPKMFYLLSLILGQVTCQQGETFFQATMQCGTCDQAANKVYDEIEMRCICQIGFYENQGNCIQCTTQNGVSYDGLNCRAVTGFMQNNPSSINIPCNNGESLFVSTTGTYQCVNDIRIRYQVDNDTGNVSDATGVFCNTNMNFHFSKRYKKCFNPNQVSQIIADINTQLNPTEEKLELSNSQLEVFGVCQTQTSALACSAALNQCLDTLNITSPLCQLYNKVTEQSSADVAQTFPFQPAPTFENLTNVTVDATADTDLSGSNYMTTSPRIPRLQAQITDVDGFILYQGNALNAFFSLCSLLRAQATNEAEYLNPQVSKVSTTRLQQYGLAARLRDGALGQSFQPGGMYGPAGESYISGSSEMQRSGFPGVFQGAGVLPRSSYAAEDATSCNLFRPARAAGLYVQFYIQTSAFNVTKIPVYIASRKPAFITKTLFPLKQWLLRTLGMNSILSGTPLYPENALYRLVYTTENLSHYLEHLELHWFFRPALGLASEGQIIGPPVIIAKYGPLQSPDSYNGQYITDTSQTSNKAIPGINKDQLPFTFNAYYHKIGLSNPNIFKIIVVVLSTLIGICLGLIQLCKQTGEYPCGCTPIYKSKFKVVQASKRGFQDQNQENENNVMRTLSGGIVEERQSQICVHYFEFVFYVIGYICIGFPFYYFFLALGNLINTYLAPWRREIFIKAYMDEQLPLEATLSFIGFFFFFGITVYRRTKAPVLFYSSRGDFALTNRNGRGILLANKYQKLQKVRPTRFWIASVLSIILYVFLDLQILATRSTTFAQDFLFRPIQEKVLLFTFLHILCSFLTCIGMFIKDLLFPSEFMKFQELCIMSGMSCVIRDNNCSLCLIKGGSDIPVDQTVGSLVLLGQKLRKHFYEPSGVTAQRIHFNSRDEMYTLISAAMLRPMGLQKLKLRGNITEEKVFKIKQYSKLELESYETAIGMACQLDQNCNSEENTGCCLPFFIVDVKRQSGTKIYLFQRKYNPNTPFYQSVQYKSVTCYNLWFYELVFFNMLLWLLGSYFYSFSAVIILSFIIYYIYQLAINRAVQKTVSGCNLIQKNFLGFIN